MKTLTVVMEGRIIQNVLLSEAIDDLQVLVIDYDIGESDSADCFIMVPQGTSKKELPAYVSTYPIIVAHPHIQQEIDTVLHRIENNIHSTEAELQ